MYNLVSPAATQLGPPLQKGGILLFDTRGYKEFSRPFPDSSYSGCEQFCKAITGHGHTEM